MQLKAFTRLYYIYSFFQEFIPLYPFYALMFADVGQLSVSEIGYLFIIWIVVAMIAEIPTGIIADRIARKNSLLLGHGLIVLTMVVWLFVPSFWGYALGFVLWGFGYAFNSGAREAYIFEVMKSLGAKMNFTKLYSKSEGIRLGGMFIAYALASLLITFGYSAILIVSIITSLIAPFILFFMPTDKIGDDTKAKSHFQMFGEAARLLLSHRFLILLGSAMILIGGVFGMMEEYIPLYYRWNGLEEQLIPYILAVGILGSSITAWVAHYFEKLPLFGSVLFFIVIGLLLAVTSLYGGIIAVVGAFLMMRVRTFITTIITAELHRSIETDVRATAGSLITFVAEIVAVASIGLYILYEGVSTPITGLTYFGITMAATGFILAVLVLGYVGWKRSSL